MQLSRFQILRTAWRGGPPKTLETRISPNLAFIQQQLRMVQGLLSFFGLESIDVQNPGTRWKPENETERKALAITYLKASRKRPDFSDANPLGFDIIARAFLIAEDLKMLEKPLNFYRHGCLHAAEEEYIDAIYDLYYVLEILFANGQSKKKLVIAEFLKADALNEAVRKALTDPVIRPPKCPNYTQKFEESLSKNNFQDVFKFIVDLRGSLHHQNRGRPHIWHPDEQMRFRCEALFIQHICYYVLSPMLMQGLYSEPIVNRYKKLFLKKESPST